LGAIADEETWSETSYRWLEDWLLSKVITEALLDMEVTKQKAQRAVATIKLLVRHHQLLTPDQDTDAHELLHTLLSDHKTQAYLGVNRHEKILWFNKEAFESMLWWLMVATAVTASADKEVDADEVITRQYALITTLQEAEATSDYQVEKLLKAVEN
jgi:hypothetical protein